MATSQADDGPDRAARRRRHVEPRRLLAGRDGVTSRRAPTSRCSPPRSRRTATRSSSSPAARSTTRCCPTRCPTQLDWFADVPVGPVVGSPARAPRRARRRARPAWPRTRTSAPRARSSSRRSRSPRAAASRASRSPRCSPARPRCSRSPRRSRCRCSAAARTARTSRTPRRRSRASSPRYELAIQTAFREVADALATRAHDRRAARRAGRARRGSPEERSSSSQARYKAGIDTFLTTLVSQRALYAAKNSLVATQLSALANRVTLYRVLGGGLE